MREVYGPCPKDSCESDDETRYFYKEESGQVNVECTHHGCRLIAAVPEEVARNLLGDEDVEAMKQNPA